MSTERQPGSSAGSRSAALRFVAMFAVYMIVGSVALSLQSVDDALVAPWTRANAAAAAGMCSLIGIDTTATGTRVQSGNAQLNVLKGCNGIHALLILLGAVLAFPAGIKARVLGVIAGTVTVFGFNLLRLVNLIVVARYFPDRLELFHIYIWQTLIVLIAFLLFLTWASVVTSPPRSEPA